MDKPLSVNDLLFVTAYFEHQRSAVKAYRLSHPKASYRTAQVEAYRVLAKPSVKAEIAKRLQYDGGITREFVQAGLLRACTLADQANDSEKIRGAYMDAAKLAGFLVEKRADVTDPASLPVPERSSRIAALLHVDPQLS